MGRWQIQTGATVPGRLRWIPCTRVVRVLKGGTVLRTYADGKTEKSEWKTGEVQIQEPGPQYTARNVGKTEVVLYVVRLK